MPRRVNHDERRAELASAALRLLVRDGLAAVTVRGVAAEAGWSTGALRHYVANQHALQEHVIRAAAAELRHRVLPRAQRPRDEADPVERIAAIVEEVLPLDEERNEEYVLWSAIAEWERSHPPMDGSTIWRDQRALYRQCIAALRGLPTHDDPDHAAALHPDPAVEQWAALLHTFVDGLASQLVTTPSQLPPEAARGLLRAFLGHVPTT